MLEGGMWELSGCGVGGGIGEWGGGEVWDG